LAWLLAKGGDIVPIPGSKRRSRVEENVAAAELALTAEDVATLDAVAPVGVASGERYPPRSMSTVYR
jgi:aryl-alcohol dehydrogenase-like predicted oxidoreductase